MASQGIKNIVIAGGGTAGWMAAASLAKLLGKHLNITLIESDAIGTVGVGEATIPTLLTLHRLLDINEQEFVAAVQGTFKLGIQFENWRGIGKDYIHSFGFTGKDCWAASFQHFWLKGAERGIVSDYGDYCTEHLAAREEKFAVLPSNGLNYAYHMDAGLYAQFLRKMAEKHGATRIEGKIDKVNLDHSSGDIRSLTLADGQTIEGDLFIDCSGFRGLLIEQALHVGYEDWRHWLPCDSAVAMQTRSVRDPLPYTRAIARESGWQWRIPLQHRVGNGLVYCSRYGSDEQAAQVLRDNVEGEAITEPRVIKFQPGIRRKAWHKNCVALGLASGFIEPLESTSIHLIQRGIIRLLQMFPQDAVCEEDINEYNRQTRFESENIRDFIILHYCVTERDDSPFWRYCRNMEIPESLAHRIELFRKTARVFKVPTELFGENSWTQVMLGQGITPQAYHPIVDMMTDQELTNFLDSIRDSVRRIVRQLPSHQPFIDRYCGSLRKAS
ncbi:tryptophan halogenase family protein [Marinimicrobium alkaliphilum]|uniref:tryptophan halogenase family protein n=1 Tax=Marinimicrobium alkaliphilum TaxID=2202654 RepID=UPI000DBA1192|nr:tryptophan halogenase family protein [Marinimicrobium alkaliphilum]